MLRPQSLHVRVCHWHWRLVATRIHYDSRTHAVSADTLAQKVAEMQAHRDTLEKKQQHLERQAQLIAKQALERNKKGDKKG